MTTLHKAAEQVLWAFELHVQMTWPMDRSTAAIAALRAALAQEQAEPAQQPVAWLQPRTVDAYSRPDLGYETCSSADYGAFPVYRAPPHCPNCASLEAQNNELDRKLAEMERAEPAAVVGTQVDVWRGCDGRWAPPGEPIKTALMLTDAPVGTMLYTTPPKRQPLTEQVDLSRCPQCNGPADNGHDRSIPPNPYFCSKCMDEPVADQTLDEAMRLPRAMAQAYESGYKAGQAHERERIIQFLTEMQRQVGDGHNHYGVAAVQIRERA